MELSKDVIVALLIEYLDTQTTDTKEELYMSDRAFAEMFAGDFVYWILGKLEGQ